VLAGALHERKNGIVTIRLHSLTFDCADAAVLGEFWAQALGRELDSGAGKEFASIGLSSRTGQGPRPR
jgi:hypothetical protein